MKKELIYFLDGICFSLVIAFIIFIFVQACNLYFRVESLEAANARLDCRVENYTREILDVGKRLRETRVELGLEEENRWQGWYTVGGK